MSVDTTVDNVLETVGSKLVILPPHSTHAEAPAKESVRRMKVLVRARPRTDERRPQRVVEDVEVTAAAPKAEPMTQRRVLALATPIIGENLLQTAVGAVDTFMVGTLGAAAVAGVGTGSALVFFLISILSAIDIGA